MSTTVLVISDHPAMQQLIGAFPSGRDWQIEAVAGPDDGLRRIESKPYGLVITRSYLINNPNIAFVRKGGEIACLRQLPPHVPFLGAFRSR